MANRRYTQFPGYLENGTVELYGNFILSASSNASGSNLKWKGVNNISCSQNNGSYVINLQDRYPTNYPFHFESTFYTSASHGMKFVVQSYDLTSLTPHISCSLMQLSGTVVGGTTVQSWVKQAPSTVVTGSARIVVKNSTST